ncbi:hypothetical protein BH20ACI3_BH20ACI3_32150 [soil metagenome]
MRLVDWIKRVAETRSVQYSPNVIDIDIDEGAEIDPYDP